MKPVFVRYIMSEESKFESSPAGCYKEPTIIGEAIQYPLDEKWVGRVLNAYRKSGRETISKPETKELPTVV